MIAINAYDEIPPHVPDHCVVDFDIYSPPGVEQDYHAGWKSLQRPDLPRVVWTARNGGHWIVTDGALIRELFADAELLANVALAVPIALGKVMNFIPLQSDGPEHGEYRKAITKGFTAKRILALEEPIVALIRELIDSFRDRGQCEFVTEFAEILPVNIFLQFAGLPVSDRPMLRDLGSKLTRGLGNMTAEELKQAVDDYLYPYVVERLAKPGDDLLSHILATPVAGRPWTLDEAQRMARNLLFGGLDTVAAMLGFITMHLAKHPEQRRVLREDPKLIGPAADEMLRRYGSVSVGRNLTRDHVIDGITMKQGDVVYLPSSLHNLDDRVFENAAEVRFDRRPVNSLTFGHGPHRCVGLALARVEIMAFLREWLQQIPDFELDPERQITMKGGSVGALSCLYLRWPVNAGR